MSFGSLVNHIFARILLFFFYAFSSSAKGGAKDGEYENTLYGDSTVYTAQNKAYPFF